MVTAAFLISPALGFDERSYKAKVISKELPATTQSSTSIPKRANGLLAYRLAGQ